MNADGGFQTAEYTDYAEADGKRESERPKVWSWNARIAGRRRWLSYGL